MHADFKKLKTKEQIVNQIISNTSFVNRADSDYLAAVKSDLNDLLDRWAELESIRTYTKPVGWYTPRKISFKGVKRHNCPEEYIPVMEGSIAWELTNFGDSGPVIDKNGTVHHPQPLAIMKVQPTEETKLLEQVEDEVTRARTLFPGNKLQYLACMEEVGEFSKALLDESVEDIRKEGIQAMAMIARVILDGDGGFLNEHRESKGLEPLAPGPKQPMKEAEKLEILRGLQKALSQDKNFQDRKWIPYGLDLERLIKKTEQFIPRKKS